MPAPLKYSRTLLSPSTVRPSAGIFTSAIRHLQLVDIRSTERLEQDFQDLDVPFRIAERRAPSVEAMTTKQDRMGRFVLNEDILQDTREPRHILIVLENRNPLPMLVRGHAVKALQHLVSADADAASGGVHIGEDGAPDRVRVEDRAGPPDPRDREVEERFGRRAIPRSLDDVPVRTDSQDVVRTEDTLVFAAGGDRQPKRLARDHGAEVAARAERPPASVASLTDLSQHARDVRRSGHRVDCT